MYAIKLRPTIDADLLKMLDPTGSAMLGVSVIKKNSWLIIHANDPSKNKIVTERVFDAEYADKISASSPFLVKLNKKA